MDPDICTVPAQVLTDAGVTRPARLCLAVMYMHIESDGFCPLTAVELAALIGTTDTAVRRHWRGLRDAGYIRESRRSSLRRRRRDSKGNDVALSLDGTCFDWAIGKTIGSECVHDGAAE